MLQVQPTLDARDGSDLDDSDASRGLLLTSTLHCPSLSDGAPLRDRTVQGMGCTCVAIRLFFLLSQPTLVAEAGRARAAAAMVCAPDQSAG